MAGSTIINRQELGPLISLSRQHADIWTHYDKEADVLYVHYDNSTLADDSEMTDDDLIIRYRQGAICGITVLNASQWK